jgi:hypothetical protein
MKGHIRERSPGHWAIILDQHDPATGRRKRKQKPRALFGLGVESQNGFGRRCGWSTC